MEKQVIIREYEDKDIDAVSNIVVRNMLEVNSKDYGIEKAFVLSNANVSKKDNIIYYPMYMLMFIDYESEEAPKIKKVDLSNL